MGIRNPKIHGVAASLRVPKGPHGRWLLGCLRQVQHDPLAFYVQASREYGDFVRIRAFPGIFVHLLTHPDAVEHILHNNHKNYRKPDFFNKAFGLLGGNGILTSEGSTWLNQRRLMQPSFHRQQLGKLASIVVDVAEAFVREQTTIGFDQPLDILAAMMRISLRIAGITLFSTDIASEADDIGQAYRTAFGYFSRRMSRLPLIPPWFPTPQNLAFRRAKQLLDCVILNLVAARRTRADHPDDLLSLLIAAQDESSGRGMSDEQLKDEALTLLTAGHETVGTALGWTWSLLGQHPQVQEDLYDEIWGRLGGRSPTLDDLASLPLTKAVFDEALRLYPPVWGLPREARQADEINGYSIPAKGIVTLNQFLTHRHPDFWVEPEKFSPERFLLGQPQNWHRFAYFPFGGGPRVCIGNVFALVEGPLVLATLLQQFRVELAQGQEIVPESTFALRPKNGVWIRFWRR